MINVLALAFPETVATVLLALVGFVVVMMVCVLIMGLLQIILPGPKTDEDK